MPRTKIVCTVGPASSSPETIREMITSGMNVARLNFSHGSHEDHAEKIRTIRSLAAELNRPVAILQDLCGPKIRVGRIVEPGIQLRHGEKFILTTEDIVGGNGRVGVSYHGLPTDVKVGDRILLADGMMEVVVVGSTATEIMTEVVTGGVLTSHKGVNLPTRSMNIETLTSKDRLDLKFGLEHDVDFVALSFVRSEEDIHSLKAIIAEQNRTTPVVAKIEKHEALNHIDSIVDAADAVMVARGDLGVEIPLENVPNIQKMIIHKANRRGRPVIIATQMLRSMVDAPRPTRAEAADVANGVLDGADAVMLSEETASGAYPLEAVRFMANIAEAAEQRFPYRRYLKQRRDLDISQSVAAAACNLAENINATAIVATTRSGATAYHVARFRPRGRIIAVSPSEKTVRRLAMCWGCIPWHLSLAEDTDEMIESAAESALQTGHVRSGDLVVITGGRPLYAAGTTNMLWVKRL